MRVSKYKLYVRFAGAEAHNDFNIYDIWCRLWRYFRISVRDEQKEFPLHENHDEIHSKKGRKKDERCTWTCWRYTGSSDSAQTNECPEADPGSDSLTNKISFKWGKINFRIQKCILFHLKLIISVSESGLSRKLGGRRGWRRDYRRAKPLNKII